MAETKEIKEKDIRQVIEDYGLWGEGREKTHGFVLSPEIFKLTKKQADELRALSWALRDCLSGIGRIAAIAVNHSLMGRNKMWQMIGSAARKDIPEYYLELRQARPGRVPAVCKVDLMVDKNGKWLIAEIDGHNKHGLGYSALTAQVRNEVLARTGAASAGKISFFPGVASAIAREVIKRNPEDKQLILLYADQERFYRPELDILADVIQSQYDNVDVRVANELEVSVEEGKVVIEGVKNPKLFMDFPFLYKNPELRSRLRELYKAKKIDFLIPPDPFLGSKAVMALLKNEMNDPRLETILLSQISPDSLEVIRSFLPETHLISKKIPRVKEYVRKLISKKNYLLKSCIGYGMKGVVFPDDEGFEKRLEKALGSNYRYVLQEEIEHKAYEFGYFAEHHKQKSLVKGEWYVRITAHFSRDARVADLIITARQDKRVHGALDCLQLGAVIV